MSSFKIHKVFIQSGKSVAVVIPSKFAEKLGLIDGCYVRISLEENRLIIEPLESKPIEAVHSEKAVEVVKA